MSEAMALLRQIWIERDELRVEVERLREALKEIRGRSVPSTVIDLIDEVLKEQSDE